MSSLSNQQINSSFSGLLQIPGGITSTLQTVQDGNGNSTGLSLSTTQAGTITASLFKPSINGTPISGSINRLINDGFGDFLSVKDFGATGDGTTDDSAFFTTADAAGLEVFVPKGNYKISSSITLNNRFSFQQGAILIIPNGVTVNFVGGVNANIYQIFNCSGTGKVVINPSKTTVGYPEWWGAVTNAGGVDCLAAIKACITACPVTQLQAGDYFIYDTLVIAMDNRFVYGSGHSYTAVAQPWLAPPTRIVVNGGVKDCIQVGPNSNPGGGSDWPVGIVLKDFCVSRNAVAVATGNVDTAARGIRAQYVERLAMERISALDHSVGFSFVNTAGCMITQCGATNNVPNALDTFYGFVFGNLSLEGNASIYLNKCGAAVLTPGLALTDSYGFWLYGHFADTFLNQCETALTNYGIYVYGSAAQSLAEQKSGNVDLHIIQPVCDQYYLYGIYFAQLSKYSCIDLSNGYFAPSGSATDSAGIFVGGSQGSVSIVNTQVIGWPDSGVSGAIGLYLNTASGVSSRNNMYTCCARPVVLDTVTNCCIEDTINNVGSVTNTIGAIYMINSTRNKIAPIIKGDSSKFAVGVNLTSTLNQYNEVNCTGINSTAVSGGSANKLIYNGTAVTATGIFGTTNLASGVMA